MELPQKIVPENRKLLTKSDFSSKIWLRRQCVAGNIYKNFTFPRQLCSDNIWSRCWWLNVLTTTREDVGNGSGFFGYQNPLSFHRTIGHQHSAMSPTSYLCDQHLQIVTNFKSPTLRCQRNHCQSDAAKRFRNFKISWE